MATYSYDDFQKAAKDYLPQFSQADLALAQNNPDVGMSLLKYKMDYANAATDEARALANYQANQLRSNYGGYTGGGNGGSFVVNPTPTYQSAYDARMKELIQQQSSYPDYSYSGAQPTYQSRYDDQIQQRLAAIQNPTPYAYDPETDPVWAIYKKQYSREGDRAAADALAKAAAMTGGVPSSYAATAAAQANNYYRAQMADKIPELEQAAYNKWLNERNLDFSRLQALEGLEQLDYGKYQDQLNQYNTDRNFDYNVYSDKYQRNSQLLSALQQQEQLDYAKYQDEQSQKLQAALTAAQYGDYSLLNSMGVDTSNNPEDFQRQYNLAVLAAQYGDYSGLQKLGIDTSMAGVKATSSGSGGSKKSGSEQTQSNDPYYYYKALMGAGATDYKTAYSLLGNMGLTQSERNTYAKRYAEEYYPEVSSGGENKRNYNHILNMINSGSFSAQNIAQSIQKARAGGNGALTDAQADYLLSLIGG